MVFEFPEYTICTPRVLELLHEELGIPMTELTKSGGDSRLLAGRTKEVLS